MPRKKMKAWWETRYRKGWLEQAEGNRNQGIMGSKIDEKVMDDKMRGDKVLHEKMLGDKNEGGGKGGSQRTTPDSRIFSCWLVVADSVSCWLGQCSTPRLPEIETQQPSAVGKFKWIYATQIYEHCYFMLFLRLSSEKGPSASLNRCRLGALPSLPGRGATKMNSNWLVFFLNHCRQYTLKNTLVQGSHNCTLWWETWLRSHECGSSWCFHTCFFPAVVWCSFTKRGHVIKTQLSLLIFHLKNLYSIVASSHQKSEGPNASKRSPQPSTIEGSDFSKFASDLDLVGGLSLFLSLFLLLWLLLFLLLFASLAGDVVMWWCGDVVMWWCGDVVMWWCGDVVMWWCGDVVMWWCGDVVMWWCGDVVMWFCSGLWRCGDVVLFRVVKMLLMLMMNLVHHAHALCACRCS